MPWISCWLGQFFMFLIGSDVYWASPFTPSRQMYSVAQHS